LDADWTKIPKINIVLENPKLEFLTNELITNLRSLTNTNKI